MPYTLKLPEFEGPLDLLIHLIEKDKVDIYDIPIESITEQYIAYLNSMQEYDLDGASEFLLMAAMLLQIKSRMLLPKDEDDDDEEGDPRQMLVEMLVVYRQFKKRAGLLRECLSQASLHAARKPMTTIGPVRRIKQYALADLLRPLANLIPTPEERPAVIVRQEFHVQDKMEEILTSLNSGTKKLPFNDIVHSGKNRSETIASFLAVLELLRLRKINIEQQSAFAPIYILRREEM
ncbi:MAG: segregation/condensation protein A [Acidaminococcus sp.]|jgi:segregation and condensation protein A|nr:segregation/condensation protein A [Acidaminococcus sp.]MCI2099467.1 segregation/condensation protein A [Acidaminococcus sp.]MCI2113827.1 segregation/condensation protein A [Acidaminococcus sp.]MCI2115599.1 segregation/condensation protein A [Acidaminococcus sp.]